MSFRKHFELFLRGWFGDVSPAEANACGRAKMAKCGQLALTGEVQLIRHHRLHQAIGRGITELADQASNQTEPDLSAAPERPSIDIGDLLVQLAETDQELAHLQANPTCQNCPFNPTKVAIQALDIKTPQ